MQECRRCGRTAPDNMIGFLSAFGLCSDCNTKFKPILIRELNKFYITGQEGLRIEQFKEYLQQKGWKIIPYGREEVIRFESPTIKYVDILIPSRIGLMDYKHVLTIATDILSTYESRDAGEVLADILKIVIKGGGNEE